MWKRGGGKKEKKGGEVVGEYKERGGEEKGIIEETGDFGGRERESMCVVDGSSLFILRGWEKIEEAGVGGGCFGASKLTYLSYLFPVAARKFSSDSA